MTPSPLHPGPPAPVSGIVEPAPTTLPRRSRPRKGSPLAPEFVARHMPCLSERRDPATWYVRNDKPKPIRTGSFCSGICAPEVAWRSLGWEPQFFSEIEPTAISVQQHHFPHVPNLGDMTKVDGAALRGTIDLLVAGTPCQAFSVAGNRKSLDDARGNLTLTFVELVHAIDPAAVVWENVPGVLSTKDNAFGCFLAGLVGEGQPLVCRDNRWPNAGMVVGSRRSAAWRVLDAQYRHLAQRRERVFVVSFRTGDGTNPGAVLFEPESLPRHSPPSREAGSRVAASLTRGADSGGAGGYAGRRREDDFNIVVNALDAHMGMGGPDDNAAQANHLLPVTGALNSNGKAAGSATQQDAENGMLVIAHTLRAEGFDASEDGAGRGIPLVPVRAYQCHGSNVGPMGTLRGGNGNETGGVPFIAQAIPLQEVGKRTGASTDDVRAGIGIGTDGDPMFTLQSGAQHGVAVLPFDTTQITSAGNFSNPKAGDPCHPLARGGHAPAIAFQERGRKGGRNLEAQIDLAYSLNAPNGGGRRQELNIAYGIHSDALDRSGEAACGTAAGRAGLGISENVSPCLNAKRPNAVGYGMAVRRLTPRECERLQGFPDDYTLVPHKGKPMADSPRYRMLGNSMAVPVLQWIGERIAKVLSTSTMAVYPACNAFAGAGGAA